MLLLLFLLLLLLGLLFPCIYLLDYPGQSEVADLDDKSLTVDENVGRFEVAVDDVGGVEVLEARCGKWYPQSIW